ncbi:sugar phosphate permease [Novosphingobium kunmingense]|uniref:Sugar phosphate permease n=1 Tax=Novosphingobium kunmingense TaxID=1211806 RepID=A0A2N0H371_9SPHN|nr:MFS transporter [Novosphingobium kunmingense]PKB13367.1 sugar phosphate permease [Novosphingobium kunmingense]
MSATSPSSVEYETLRKVRWRLLPFLTVCYLFALIDRTNVGMASLQMTEDLGITKAQFGFGASLFFVAYFLVEIPSNLALEKYGARRWIARIMITWGLVSAAMAFVQGATSFYIMRFVLGAAEAGFFPGIIFYLTLWMPARQRGKAMALFALGIPLASFVSSPISGALLTLDGTLGLHGWQWLFLVEGLPASLLGIACLFWLSDRPRDARWLTPEQREWLEQAARPATNVGVAAGAVSKWAVFRSWQFWGFVLACCGASASGSVLAVWQPQFLKSFGLSDFETGLVNAIPYGVATVAMVIWGYSSDRLNERRWHTAIPLLLIGLSTVLVSFSNELALVVLLLTCCLVGAYSFKGPFWSMASAWLSPASAAVGIAAINATANLIGGGLMVNVYGWVFESTGSYAAALAPLSLLALASAMSILVMARGAGDSPSQQQAAIASDQT